MDLKNILLICIIFFLFTCTKTTSKPSETITPESFETQEDTDIENWWKYDNFWDIAEDPQTANKILIYYLEKQDKTTSDLSLISIDTGNFTDYTPLLAFKNLTILNIYNRLIADISGITVLSQHKKLSELLLSAEKVTDISPLSALVNLRLLSVDVSKTCTVTSELLPLVHLEILAFSKASFETIRSISKLTWLKKLYLSIDNEDIDISPIQNLKNLEHLKITGPLYKNTEFDISWISQLLKLQEIEFSGLKITDVSPLLKLPNIKRIDVMWSAISDENIALLKKTGAVVVTYADADR